MAASARATRPDRTRVVARLILRAAREVQMLGALTPIDAHRERARLVAALRDGQKASPRWTYARWQGEDLRRALDAAERALAHDTASPLEQMYLERVRELSVEAALCAAAGTRELARLARARFAPESESEARRASALGRSWVGEPHDPAPGETVASDADDPGSLLSIMRATVRRLRLPFSVAVQPALAALAATGDGVILVAAGRPLTAEDTARTVLHEIDGHARPRTRAMQASLSIFRAGTARGVDDQEGLALRLEERAGLLGPKRRRQLAIRHQAFEAMDAGAAFPEVAAWLIREHGLEPPDAVLVAERVFRGGDGTGPGLGRERVYLEAFARVSRHLRAHPEDEAVLASGQVSVGAASALRAFI